MFFLVAAENTLTNNETDWNVLESAGRYIRYSPATHSHKTAYGLHALVRPYQADA